MEAKARSHLPTPLAACMQALEILQSPLLGPTGVGREEGQQFPSRKAQVEAAVGNPEDNGQIPDTPGSLPRVSQVALVVKNLPANAGVTGDPGSIPG